MVTDEPAQSGELVGAEYETTGASKEKRPDSPVPTIALTEIAMNWPVPLPPLVRHCKVVALDHAVVWQAVASNMVVGV